MKVKPMGILLMMPTGWINRRQQDVIEYLKEENRILQGRHALEFRESVCRWFRCRRDYRQSVDKPLVWAP